jgi:hypothetical protein
MRLVIKIVFVLAFLALNICLIVPIVGGRGMSWVEASLGIVPGALVAFICFFLLLAGIGAKGRQIWPASRWWTGALLWSLLLGGIVTFVTTTSYNEYRRSDIYQSLDERDRSEQGSSLEAAYARDDAVGIMIGWTTLGFAGLSLVGLVISLAMKKNVPDMTPGT